ncbi:hypothetical protein [Zavarzinia aquatilis]|uniref:Uncharacterized protein n=1 Tax=Zavarzinia aquatilis TaxID=2211142 RepID=A0A317E729_9PROT|nr:hypothetical protein [Zavarzinia aquatilis]PWR21213.1 hypothetical protein DKG74_14505 [Zavarzinia aquatilis]
MAREKTCDHYHIAIRCAEAKGWVLVFTCYTPDQIRARLVRRGKAPVELRELLSAERGFPMRTSMYRRGSTADTLASHTGWVYDDIACCWWPPEAPITVPSPRPRPTADFSVTFAMPEFGWLPVTLVSGSQKVYFEASEVFDPLPGFVRWLEKVASGGASRFVFDVEDTNVEFHIMPAPDADFVRFVVAFTMLLPTRSFELDIVLGRRQLVTTLYSALRKMWTSDAFQADPTPWFCDDPVEAGEPPYEFPYSIVSPVLEALIED